MDRRRHVLIELSDGSGEWMDVPYVAPSKGYAFLGYPTNMMYAPGGISFAPAKAALACDYVYNSEPSTKSFRCEITGYPTNMVYSGLGL